MCDPVTLITIGSSIAGFLGDRQAANAQEAANAPSRALALQNQNLQIQTLQNREDEENKRATKSLVSNTKAAEAARATAAVAAGESGVSGLSVDALLGDVTRQEIENQNTVLETQDFGQRQRQLDREGLAISTQSQINQLPLVEFPDFFEFAFDIGSNFIPSDTQ